MRQQIVTSQSVTGQSVTGQSVTGQFVTGQPVSERSAPDPGPLAWSAVGIRCGWLMLAVAATLGVAGWWNGRPFGRAGWEAAAIAAAVCGAGSLAALVIAARSRGPNRALFGLLAGIVLRMFVPLVVGVWLDRTHAAWSEAGVLRCVLWFYLVTLVVETWLVLPLVQGPLVQGPLVQGSVAKGPLPPGAASGEAKAVSAQAKKVS